MKQIVFAVAMMALVASCANIKFRVGDKAVAEEQRELTGFERIEQFGSLDVRYRQGDTFSVRVEAPKDVVKDVETIVRGNCLVVRMKGEGSVVNFGIADSDGVTVYVTSPDFLGIELRGSGDFVCEGLLDTDNLDIWLKGSGDITFNDVICDRANIQQVGSGDVKVRQLTAQQTDVELVGSGDMEVTQRQVAQTRIELKGSGDIKMKCRQCGSVISRLIGSGDITLNGDVASLGSSTRGSGDINTDGLTVGQKQ
jgi:hypothetical protein